MLVCWIIFCSLSVSLWSRSLLWSLLQKPAAAKIDYQDFAPTALSTFPFYLGDLLPPPCLAFLGTWLGHPDAHADLEVC